MSGLDREAEILRLFPLVRTIARVVWRQLRYVDLDDLVGDGSLGLVAAVDSYDPARGMSLERYARRKILYAMLDAARRSDHLPRFTRLVLQSAERDRYALALELGRMPSAVELERRHPKLRSAQRTAHLRRPVSLDASDGLEALRPHQVDVRVAKAKKVDALRAAVGALRQAGYGFVTLREAAGRIEV